MAYTEGQTGHLALHGSIDTTLATHTANIAAGDVTNPASAAGISLSATIAAAVASKIMTGSGSPQGVVTADVGTLYTDTAATLGVSIWRKASGTGNTGWVVLEGNTGWRDIRATLGSSFSTSYLRIKRDGNTVMVIGAVTPAASIVGTARQTLQSAFLLPSGMAAPFYLPLGVTSVSSNESGLVGTLTDPSTISLNFPSGTWTAAEFLFSATYLTDAAWPTSLPGTAA